MAIEIKSDLVLNKTELARLYNTSYTTLQRWLIPIHEKIGWIPGPQTFFPAQIKIIFEFLDTPEGFEKYLKLSTN
jgi:hypothetical protein